MYEATISDSTNLLKMYQIQIYEWTKKDYHAYAGMVLQW